MKNAVQRCVCRGEAGGAGLGHGPTGTDSESGQHRASLRAGRWLCLRLGDAVPFPRHPGSVGTVPLPSAPSTSPSPAVWPQTQAHPRTDTSLSPPATTLPDCLGPWGLVTMAHPSGQSRKRPRAWGICLVSRHLWEPAESGLLGHLRVI